MITEDYVSFETAKLLKEKGFDVAECQNSPHFAYNIDGHFSGPSWDTKYNAPTLQMAMKWLREEKDVQIEILIVETDTWESPTKWVYGFRCQTKGIIARRKANFLSYEEACEAAIKYCLENLI